MGLRKEQASPGRILGKAGADSAVQLGDSIKPVQIALLPFFSLAAWGIQAPSGLLEGVIDIHVDTATISVPRGIDAIDLARLSPRTRATKERMAVSM